MSEQMFCFQCEQTAGGVACTTQGVCGKSPEVAEDQDELIAALIDLATLARDKGTDADINRLIIEGLFTTISNVNYDSAAIDAKTAEIQAKAKSLGDYEPTDPDSLFKGDEDVVSLRSTLLFGVKGMAAYAEHAMALGYEDESIAQAFIKYMAALMEDHSVDEWLTLLMEFGQDNLTTMALLDKAHNETYGTPNPRTVSTHIEPGPFIIVTGHDMRDIHMLLEQTKDQGVNVYTHGEMLPAHGYPTLQAYDHFKGHFGTAWNNQRKEFDEVPAPILYTTNCILPPRDSYIGNIYTTSVVGWPGCHHIEADADGNKDFSKIIAHAKELGGYDSLQEKTGWNGGHSMTTGFAHGPVLAQAETIVEAVKAGNIRHFFLVGGCDGAKPGRSYYTDFVEQTPDDTIVLTLACGKFRFNDMDLGEIGGFPRIMDMGQCNDAYSAIQVAVALAEAFDTDVNSLPLSIVLSWYEQKAVCVLLTLLSLGIKNIYIGPSLPAFFSENVLNVLVEKFDLHPLGTPQEDMATMLG